MLAKRGLGLNHSHDLHDAFAASLSVEGMGFTQFAGVQDIRTRASASDSVLSAADAVETNLGEAAIHSDRYANFVGPNGRVMPGPETTDADRQADIDGEAEMVAFFRAVGSMLDCLAAVTIGVLRLPRSIDNAGAADLINLRRDAKGVVLADGQREAMGQVATLLDAHRARARGWLEWTVEMRNQLVHRGRQMTVWMPLPGRGATGLQLPRDARRRHLARYEPHFRRQPWLPEMERLGRQSDRNMWLAEPATKTMQSVLATSAEMTNRMAALLLDIWTLRPQQTADWAVPDEAWDPVRRPSRRVQEADHFQGFDRAYRVPPPGGMAVSPRDAPRFQIAEVLRQQDAEREN